jgi:16S rRNA (guanine527-N7)-methyltransferase
VEPSRPDGDVPRETSRSRLAPHGTADRSTRLDRIAQLIGRPLSDGQREALERFERWLVEEAQPAGGIGPQEHDRVFDRHIADSLLFLTRDPRHTEPWTGAGIVDVGSGVGLPGIPLAIAAPDLEVTLLDRSGRRGELARRALRILGLRNVTVVSGDSRRRSGAFDRAVFRASLPIASASEVFLRMTHSDGDAVFGVSRDHRTPIVPPAPDGVVFTLTPEGTDVLDSPCWLLRMRRT